jgi:hypothetical protein
VLQSQLRASTTKIEELEQANQNLRRLLEKNGAAAFPRQSSTTPSRKWKWPLFLVSGLLLVGCLLSFALAKGCDGRPSHPGTQASSSHEPSLPVISSSDVAKYDGKVCTVQLTVKSSYDGFDWGFLLNSEEDSRDPKNFTVVIDRATAGQKYKEIGVTKLADYFKKGTAIQVTGRIVKYNDKRTNRTRYEIRVRDPDSIKRL